jgi:hypothetical protein
LSALLDLRDEVLGLLMGLLNLFWLKIADLAALQVRSLLVLVSLVPISTLVVVVLV